MDDHIHILFRMSKNHSLARIIEEVKKQSSKWIKEIDAGNNQFAWQKGYAAFSVSSSKVEIVTRYIQNQEQHHQSKSFVAEIREFMEKYDVVEFNEEYFWN